MKIVFCTQNLAPFRMRWIDELAKCHLVIVYHLGEYEKTLNNKYISYKPKKAIIKNNMKSSVFGLKRYNIKDIIGEDGDVYLLDGYGFFGIQELILTLFFKKIPFLMSVDGGFIKKDNLFIRYIKKFFMSRAASFFSTSGETDRYINYYGGYKEKYRHLFSNYTSDYIEKRPTTVFEKQTIKNKLQICSGFTVISVGKFEYRKGFDLLIEAIKKLDIDVNLYLIGASDNITYNEIIDNRIRKKIHFVKFCSQTELKEYYKATDLMLLPTREDIWGLVISESMANGAITVTTDKCLAGIAMLPSEDIIPTNNVQAIIDIIKLYYFMPESEKIKIGQRNIEISRQYAIDVAVKNDLKHLEEFHKENMMKF